MRVVRVDFSQEKQGFEVEKSATSKLARQASVESLFDP
jgi:hypothetical protein